MTAYVLKNNLKISHSNYLLFIDEYLCRIKTLQQ